MIRGEFRRHCQAMNASVGGATDFFYQATFGDGNTTWADTTYASMWNRWINFATREVAEQTDCQTKTTTATVTINVPTVALPTDACKIYSIAYDGHPLVYVTLENLTSKEGADWATVTGDPAYWLNLSSTAATASIWLYPKPAATLAGGIVYYHSYYPAALTDGATADATEIDLPSQGLNAAMWRTLIFAGIRDFENPAARARLAEYRAEYQQALKQVKESVALPHAGPYYVTEYDASYE